MSALRRPSPVLHLRPAACGICALWRASQSPSFQAPVTHGCAEGTVGLCEELRFQGSSPWVSRLCVYDVLLCLGACSPSSLPTQLCRAHKPHPCRVPCTPVPCGAWPVRAPLGHCRCAEAGLCQHMFSPLVITSETLSSVMLP